VKIALLTGNSLCHNPRVVKEASALARAGHDVHVLGAWHERGLKERDLGLLEALPFAFVPVLDFTLPGTRNHVARFLQRLGRKSAQLAYRIAGRESPMQLGLGIGRMVRLALDLQADLYIVHSEAGLEAGHRLLRRGRSVGVDMEDWFSEDLLPEARRHRPIALLRALESELLLRGVHASCPSHAMSRAIAGAYSCTPPTVVYNAFPWSERQSLDARMMDRQRREIPSIHWYSTTLGPGRGLEELVEAISLLKHDVELHLRGNPVAGFAESLKSRAADRWRGRLFFHSVVPNGELLSRIAEHDIGFAGEQSYCRSRELTVTNKILHYLLGGLAVVASDTAGQREVAQKAPGAVSLYAPGNAQQLAELLDSLIASPERLRAARAAALAAALEALSWERQEPTLLDAVAHALAQPVSNA
jgi:glycosyltransferase involved in cell wall biosynthesis